MTDEKNPSDKQEEVSLEDLNLPTGQAGEKIKEAEAGDDQSKKMASKEEELQAKVDELTEALARAMADLKNYKRRTEEQQGSFVKFANAELLKQLIPTIDNFIRCTDSLPEDLKENDWVKGVVQIHDNLISTLKRIGVQKIKTVGEKLDPNLHEALMTGPGKQDEITEELEPGYTLNDTVIKAAKVKVGDGSKK